MSGPIDLTFEQARAELDEIVRRLEGGGTTLDEALGLWERGEALHRHCVQVLTAAEERLRAARPGAAGDGDARG